MVRKSGSSISQEELYPAPGDAAREELDDSRVLDMDADDESPFLRGQKRVSVRRSIPKKTASRLTWGAIAAGLVFVCCLGVAALYHYGEHSWRFRVESSDDIQVAGLGNVTRAQVMDVMGGDIGRNIFFIPLSERKKQLEQIPWVESASVMRFAPNRLRVEIHERTPVAFARVGSRILLIDGSGMLMELPAAGGEKYSFPVILGTNPGEPLSTRAARMKIYADLTSQLDAGGAHYSQDLSEVDLSDPEDVKVLANDSQGEVLVHLGSSNYLDRYKVYVSHVQQWRQQFDKLESVDLRYDRQVIVNPDLGGVVKQAPLSLSAVKSAMAAGVKSAALVRRERLPAKTIAATPSSAKTVAKTPAQFGPTRAVVAKATPTRAMPLRPLPVTSTALSGRISAAKPVAPKPAPARIATRKPWLQHRATTTAAAKGHARQSSAKPHAALRKENVPAPAHSATMATTKKPSPAIAKSQEQQ